MRFYKKCLFSILTVFNCGCQFSSDAIHDFRLDGSLYISSFDGKNTLLFKDHDDEKRLGSGNVILDNVDSIGLYKSKILAYSDGQYFLIDAPSHKIVNKFNSCQDMKRDMGGIDCGLFGLHKIVAERYH